MLTQAIQDYLKIIYKLHREGEGVTTTAIAANIHTDLANWSEGAMCSSPVSGVSKSDRAASQFRLQYRPQNK